MTSDLEVNSRSYEASGLEWHDSVAEEVLEQLGDLLAAVSRIFNPSESQIGRTTVAAIASIGSEDGLRIYEQLMADDKAIGGSFYWYERDRLRRQIAAQRVLERLPSDFAALGSWLEERRWLSDSTTRTRSNAQP